MGPKSAKMGSVPDPGLGRSGPRDWPKSRFLTWKMSVSGGPRRKWIFFEKKIPFFRQRVKNLWKVSTKKRHFFGHFFTFFEGWFFGFWHFKMPKKLPESMLDFFVFWKNAFFFQNPSFSKIFVFSKQHVFCETWKPDRFFLSKCTFFSKKKSFFARF